MADLLGGHGASGTAERDDLEAMAGDVIAVLQKFDLVGTAHIVDHSALRLLGLTAQPRGTSGTQM